MDHGGLMASVVLDEPSLEEGLDLMQKFNADKSVEDLAASIAALRSRGCAKVGVVGYCLGGRLAFLCAARTDSDATVGYYGVGLDNLLGERQNISKPLLLHIATRDKILATRGPGQGPRCAERQSAGHDLRVRRRSRLRAWQRQRAGASAGAAGRCTDASVFWRQARLKRGSIERPLDTQRVLFPTSATDRPR